MRELSLFTGAGGGLLRTPRRNQYVDIARGWTHQELTRYMQYFSNLKRTRPIAFAEFNRS